MGVNNVRCAWCVSVGQSARSRCLSSKKRQQPLVCLGGLGYMTLTMSRYRVYDCALFKVVEVDGCICEDLHPTSPSLSDILSKYFNRPVNLIMI